MRRRSLLKSMGAAVVGLAATLAVTQTVGAAESFKMASLGSASPSTTFSIAAIEILKKEYGYKIQLSTGAPATRQAVDAAKKDLDLFVTAVSINHFMKTGTKMYAKMADSKELFAELRGILNYPLGSYHGIVWADSGIETLDDIKGKRIFTGPPSGAARTVVEQIIKGSTGYEPKKDFDAINLDWSSALQAFQDKQVDVYFVPTSIPSPQVAQLATIGKIRILGIPDSALDSEEMKAASSLPGRGFVTLPKGQYENLVNETDVRVLNTMVGLGTNKWMSEEDAYKITKGIFTHNAELAQAAAWMKNITPETGLQQMNMPLHIGAYKYYKEVGVEVPDELIPPEAK
ncbi:TAXI family TRAP transporter solute-binding subunit [Sneathiella chungangensis]|uniref:TAXI family TRAP transporter solute-binding subunit n=1 Tax=Sneathiella chungangensis TaxID=1418234 RepID=A0A845MHH7_9PROT|nr:TAXI family TRAP transporter solute-binding subunit [Sneathiella chungangensis]MZR22870.1 TAXI family TRAP transporter solute-binding subunit [Sneathiella chungangensis]